MPILKVCYAKINFSYTYNKISTPLKSLRRAAMTMDCELVYALVPITNLEDTLRNQIRKAVQAQMILAPESGDGADRLKVVGSELMERPPRWLWDIK